MEYRYAADRDGSDLASGHVLRSAPGQPAFPVRLGLELLHRAIAELPPGAPTPTLWDPCCGAAQLVTSVALRARRHLAGVVASDIDPAALELARRNLRLLTLDGLDDRRRELAALAETHGKRSHRDAASAAERLHTELATAGGDLPVAVGQLDALDPEAVRAAVEAWAAAEPSAAPWAAAPWAAAPSPASASPAAPWPATPLAAAPDLVLADVPHGRMTAWQAAPPSTPDTAPSEDPPPGTPDTAPSEAAPPSTADATHSRDPDKGPGDDPAATIGRFVSTLAAALPPTSVIVVVSRARRIHLPPGTSARQRLRVGHRAAAILRAGDVRST